MWLEDFQSEHFNKILANDFYLLENKYREVINEILTYNLGSSWSDKYTKVYNLPRKESIYDYKQKVSIFKDIDANLFTLLTGEISDIIMKPTVTVVNDENYKEVLEEIMKDAFSKDNVISDKKLRDKIKDNEIFDKKSNSLYEDFFAKLIFKEEGNRMLKNLWEDIVKRRNHIAHNKPIDIIFYKKTKSDFEHIKDLLDGYMENFYKLETECESLKIPEKWNLKNDFLKLTNDTTTNNNETKENDCIDRKIDNHYLKETVVYEEIDNDYEELFQEEAGIDVLSGDEISELMGENIDEKVDLLFEKANELDLIITTNNSFNFSNILLEVEHKLIKNRTMKIAVLYTMINDSRGGTSEVEITSEIDGVNHRRCKVRYTNPDYEYNEEQSNYMPSVLSVLEIEDLDELIEDLDEYLDEEFFNVLLKASEDNNSYSRITDGGNQILLEADCPYCYNYETVCVSSDIFGILDIDWSEELGVCLECGEICSVGENAQGVMKVAELGTDTYSYGIFEKQ